MRTRAERRARTAPDYFWFDPATLELSGFHLVDGQYQPLSPDASGRVWSAQLGLFLGVERGQLRFFTPAGELVPAGLELAQRAESAEQRAARLAEKLRELGVDPDTLK
ncbi:hypothetical protein WMF42_20420 [Sorangium sp. So ce176]